MHIYFTRGFSLRDIARELVITNPDLHLTVPPAQVPENTPRISADPMLPHKNHQQRWMEGEKVDLIIPMRGETTFDNGSIPVMRFSSPPVKRLLEDKFLFAEDLRYDPHHLPTIKVQSAEDIQDAIKHFEKDVTAVGIKPRKGVYGNGYWTLTEGDPLLLLSNPDNRTIQSNHYIYGARMSHVDHVVMPYLPGPEVTFDILAWQGRALAWCSRTKNNDNEDQFLSHQHELQDHAASLIERYGLHGPIGIQYRKSAKGTWHVLEINDRPCGGIVKSEAAGAGLIEQWGGLLTNRLTPDQVQHRPVNATLQTQNRYHIIRH